MFLKVSKCSSLSLRALATLVMASLKLSPTERYFILCISSEIGRDGPKSFFMSFIGVITFKHIDTHLAVTDALL